MNTYVKYILKTREDLIELCEKQEAALLLSRRALIAPMDEWKGELERPALDAIAECVPAIKEVAK